MLGRQGCEAQANFFAGPAEKEVDGADAIENGKADRKSREKGSKGYFIGMLTGSAAIRNV